MHTAAGSGRKCERPSRSCAKHYVHSATCWRTNSGGLKSLGLRFRRHPAVPHAQKKSLFENNQMIGRGWVWGASDTGTLSQMTVLLTVLF